MDERGIFSFGKITLSLKTRSTHSESAVEHDDLERKVFDWALTQCETAVTVSTSATAAKSLATSSSF